jgi:hypothetical protein
LLEDGWLQPGRSKAAAANTITMDFFHHGNMNTGFGGWFRPDKAAQARRARPANLGQRRNPAVPSAA